MLTAAGPLCRFRSDVPGEVVTQLALLSAKEPAGSPLPQSPTQRDRYLEALGAHAPVERLWSGPAYRLARDALTGGAAIAIGRDNAQLLEGRFDDWLADVPHRQPFMAILAGGRAASICASVRISPTVHCAGVETHPDFRRRGLALQAAAGWAAAVQALGATPFYSTSWDNLASQAVARRPGFTLVGVDFHVS